MGDDIDVGEYVWIEPPFTKPPCSELNHKLKNLELNSLICPCCHEFFDNAVTLRPCHHSFCSQCIRRRLATRNGVVDTKCCPVCRCKLEIKRGSSGQKKQLSEEEAIIPNHGLQKVVNEYKALRSTMIETLLELQNLKQSAANENGGGGESSDKKSEESSKKRDISQLNDRPNMSVGSSSVTNDITEPEVTEVTSKRPRRSCNKTKNYGEMEDTLDEKKYDDREAAAALNNNLIDSAKSSVINLVHEEGSVVKNDNRVRLEQKKFILTGKKEKQLREMCRREGISDRGKEAELRERIKRFGDFWKSECDREIHRPAEEIVKEFKNAEASRAAEEKKSKMWNRTVNFSSISKITPEMKSGFDKLIAQAGKSTAKRARSSIINDGGSTQSETIHISETVNTNNSEDSNNSSDSSTLSSAALSSSSSCSVPMNKINPLTGPQSQATNASTRVNRVTNPYKKASSPPKPSRVTNPYAKKKVSPFQNIRSNTTQPTGQIATWDCNVCTFQNKFVPWSKTRPKCKMCASIYQPP